MVYYVPRGGSPPWSAIARELAYAFRLDTDAGPIATGIKEVLAAPTAAEAEQALACAIDDVSGDEQRDAAHRWKHIYPAQPKVAPVRLARTKGGGERPWPRPQLPPLRGEYRKSSGHEERR